MDLGAIRRACSKGFIADDEAIRLYELAREASSRGPCLEIGSYCGLSAACLGSGCRENGGILFSIDHHRGSEEQQPGEAYFDPELLDPASGRIDTFPIFVRTLCALGLDETVVPIVSRSQVVARGWSTPLGLLFIDGGHGFRDAFADYAAWAPHLRPGGFLAIHDLFADPADGGQAPLRVYKIALASGLFEELAPTGTLGVLRRLLPGQVPAGSPGRWPDPRG